MDNGRKPVCDDERGSVLRNLIEGRLDLLFGEAVERRCRLVQHQDRRRFQDRPRDGDALLFASG